MPTSPSSNVALPQSIERYRSVIIAAMPFLIALLAQLSDSLQRGRPLGGVEVIQVIVAGVALAAVYFPASAWVKFAAAVAGAIGQWIVAASTDSRFTPAELLAVGSAILAAAFVGGLPNAPATVIAEPGDDVPAIGDVTGGSTYGGPLGR